MNNIIHIKYRQRGKFPLDRSEHRHSDCYEIIQTLSGSGTVLIHDRIYPIIENAVYLINATNVHCTNPSNAEDYLRNIMVIDRFYTDKLIELLGLEDSIGKIMSENSGGLYLLDTRSSEQIDGEFKRCAGLCSGETVFAAAEITRSLTSLLLILLRSAVLSDTRDTALARVINFINPRLCEKLTVDDIASSLNISKYHLCHEFRRKSGMTIMDYILERRMCIAKEKLLNTDDSVCEIAASCGFVNSSHFSRVFKESEGLSPREYRKSLN